jgi:hypothetical protein
MASTCAVLVALFVTQAANALITGAKGNQPVENHGWPEGCVEVANLETRLGWWEGPPFGGGEYHFEYRGDVNSFQRALDLLAKVEAKERLLVVHDGSVESFWLKDEKDPKVDARYDWSFTVWNPKSYDQLYNNPTSTFSARDPRGHFRQPLPPPQIDVYIGGAPAGAGVDWSRVMVPAGLTVRDERASAHGYPPDAGSVLRGRVTEPATSKPVGGAKVVVMKYTGKGQEYEEVASTAAGDDGKFELLHVPTGSFRIHAAANGYATRLLGHDTFRGDTLKQYPSALLAPAKALSGMVTLGDGKPVAGLTVRVDSLISSDGKGYIPLDHPQAVTDAKGRFTFGGLPAGSCQLFVHGTGYTQQAVLERHDIPADDVTIRMSASGNVRGKVTRNGDVPIDASYIANLTPEGGDKVGSWSGSMQIKADGTFEFTDVPPGKYTVTARPNPGRVLKGKDPNEKAIVVESGKTIEVEIDFK